MVNCFLFVLFYKQTNFKSLVFQLLRSITFAFYIQNVDRSIILKYKVLFSKLVFLFNFTM